VMFDMTHRTRRTVAGALAVAIVATGAVGTVLGTTASNGAAPPPTVAPAKATPKAPTAPVPVPKK
jgi:hypothetical protein